MLCPKTVAPNFYYFYLSYGFRRPGLLPKRSHCATVLIVFCCGTSKTFFDYFTDPVISCLRPKGEKLDETDIWNVNRLYEARHPLINTYAKRSVH